MRTDDLDYHLPPELIATRPADPRDSARMLVVPRGGGAVEHRHVRDLSEYVRAGDVMVCNDTTVMPARLVGRRVDSGGRVQGLFLDAEDDTTWRVMLKSNGKLRAAARVELCDRDDTPTGVELELVERDDDAWRVRVHGAAGDVLDRAGRTPLPPYILSARADETDDALDRSWYQTVYADPERRGSVAAPTAGLHFTDELLEAIDRTGTRRAAITLHVGAGTFKPVTAESLDEHTMHSERFDVAAETLAAIDAADRVLAIGTTTVRCLESLPSGATGDHHGETDILIAPGHAFRRVDAMLTNFHLPKSTLLALVAAFIGLERVLEVYEVAVAEGYRFYSYGDAMLIV